MGDLLRVYKPLLPASVERRRLFTFVQGSAAIAALAFVVACPCRAMEDCGNYTWAFVVVPTACAMQEQLRLGRVH